VRRALEAKPCARLDVLLLVASGVELDVEAVGPTKFGLDEEKTEAGSSPTAGADRALAGVAGTTEMGRMDCERVDPGKNELAADVCRVVMTGSIRVVNVGSVSVEGMKVEVVNVGTVIIRIVSEGILSTGAVDTGAASPEVVFSGVNRVCACCAVVVATGLADARESTATGWSTADSELSPGSAPSRIAGASRPSSHSSVGVKR